MLDSAQLETAVAGIFKQTLNLVPPSVDTDLFTEGGLDSLRLVDLLVKLEQTFNTRIPLEQLELDNFRSVASIARFLGGFLREKQTAGNPCH